MNPKSSEIESAVDYALRDWKKKVPLNREGRRNQLTKYKYHLELNEGDAFWSVYGVRKDGSRFMIDNSANHIQKKKDPDLTEDPSVSIAENNSENLNTELV
jgi:hypothetical protein